jgi:hypothetical protein
MPSRRHGRSWSNWVKLGVTTSDMTMLELAKAVKTVARWWIGFRGRPSVSINDLAQEMAMNNRVSAELAAENFSDLDLMTAAVGMSALSGMLPSLRGGRPASAHKERSLAAVVAKLQDLTP